MDLNQLTTELLGCAVSSRKHESWTEYTCVEHGNMWSVLDNEGFDDQEFCQLARDLARRMAERRDEVIEVLSDGDELPGWDRMSDLDRGCALLHVFKVDSEGESYATENYPARYRDDPDLTELDDRASSEHARWVCGDYDEVVDRLGLDEFERLYEMALTRSKG